MESIYRRGAALLFGVSMAFGWSTSVAQADPLIWESNFGTELNNLSEYDDGAEQVTLSFQFPYAGSSYDSLFIGTNGAVGLGGLGEADDYPSGDEFINTTDPMLAPFWSDMSLDSMGSIWINDFGDRAVVTWDAIGTYQNEYAPFTFQLQILQDGQIIFGYNGISEVNDENIDEYVHIGLTEGNLEGYPTEIDYSADAPFLAADSILELIEYDWETFDLDGQNIIFSPQELGGYQVQLPEPATALFLAIGVASIARRRR